MRTKGSCQFDTYYKIEKWDARFLVWTPIQKPFATCNDAVKFAETKTKDKTRIMEVTTNGYKEI